MTTDTLDAFRRAIYEIAEAIAPTWERRRAEVEEVSTPVREWMLRELRPREGDTVLELAAGVGETGFEAAAAVGGDLVFPGVQGRRTLKVRLVNAYLARLHASAAHDASLASTFLRVAGLVAPPQSLLRPSIVLGVLRARPRPAAVARGRLQHREAVPAAQAERIAGCMTAPREVGAVPSYGQASRPEAVRFRAP